MLMNVDADAQASLKMKSDRFEKASEEIGVPRGKKSERYRSTPHYRSRSLKMKSARFEKASQEIGVLRAQQHQQHDYRSGKSSFTE